MNMLQYKAESIDITPEKNCTLSGMESRYGKSSGIHSPLEVNTMLFNIHSTSLFFISIDTLFISKSLKELILQQIKHNFGKVSESDVWLMASHTHYAPSLEEERTALGSIDKDYFAFLGHKIEQLFLALAGKPFLNVKLSSVNLETRDITVNRRRKVRIPGNYFKPFIAMEPDPKGYKNEKLNLVKVLDDSDDHVLGAIWQFPCHPTNLHDPNLISAEFPGTVRSLIRQLTQNEKTTAVFMQGFSGNIRACLPENSSPGKLIRRLLQLSYPVKYYKFTGKNQYDQWCQKLTNQFKRAWSMKGKELNINKLQTNVIKKNLHETLGISATGIENITFRKVSFDNRLTFVSVSAEAVAEYSAIAEQIAGPGTCISVGYVDEVFGYLPTQRQIEEGGYESGEYFGPFLITGKFSAETEQNIKSCLKEVLSK